MLRKSGSRSTPGCRHLPEPTSQHRVPGTLRPLHQIAPGPSRMARGRPVAGRLRNRDMCHGASCVVCPGLTCLWIREVHKMISSAFSCWVLMPNSEQEGDSHHALRTSCTHREHTHNSGPQPRNMALLDHHHSCLPPRKASATLCDARLSAPVRGWNGRQVRL
jgi:hypothetical protein